MNVRLDDDTNLVHLVWEGYVDEGFTACGESYVRKHPQARFDDRWIGVVVETPATCFRCLARKGRLR